MIQGVLVSRQPIFRSDKTVLGYELLFRNGDFDSASFPDGSRATAQVLVNSFMDIGISEIVGPYLAFVNFERELLLGEYCEALPPERMVLEILETVEPDADVIRRLQHLRSQGYRIALDDFICSKTGSPFLELADFVKIDLLANDWPTVERTVDRLRKLPVTLLAEKVETHEQAESCKAIGFELFQGYFLCRPQNISSKRLPPNRLATIRLLGLLNKPDLKMEELEAAVSQDLSLSYKLLRYINSAMCGIHRHVESIRHAVVLVGLEKMRAWANLVLLSGFDDIPREILVTGAMRARMCERLATTLRYRHPEQHFLVGLFSVLDAIVDRPMPQILSMLSLSDEINSALLEYRGELGMVLRWVRDHERREWDDTAGNARVARYIMEQTYLDAVAWSSGIVGLSGHHAEVSV